MFLYVDTIEGKASAVGVPKLQLGVLLLLLVTEITWLVEF